MTAGPPLVNTRVTSTSTTTMTTTATSTTTIMLKIQTQTTPCEPRFRALVHRDDHFVEPTSSPVEDEKKVMGLEIQVWIIIFICTIGAVVIIAGMATTLHMRKKTRMGKAAQELGYYRQ